MGCDARCPGCWARPTWRARWGSRAGPKILRSGHDSRRPRRTSPRRTGSSRRTPMAQQRMSDYIDKIHGRAFIGEHFSEDDLRHDDEEALAPSLAPKAASTVASKASPQAPAKATATKGQM